MRGLVISCMFFFFQAEDGIRYLVRSRGLGDVYKRQGVKKLRVTYRYPSYLGLKPVSEEAGGDIRAVEGLSLIHI